MNLAHLPYTVFFEIVSHLSALEALLARAISPDVCSALTRPDLSISLILLHFPRSLEGRVLRGYLGRVSAPDEERERALDEGDWAAVFATLVRRYHHLGTARPWRVRKVRLASGSSALRLRGVTPWNRFLRLDDKTAAFDYWDPVWTCAPREGVLVYPYSAGGRERDDEIVYRARDLASGVEVDVPFRTRGRVVRRARLSHGILIFEWCEEEGHLEPEPQPQPQSQPELEPELESNTNGGTEAVAHRHFATAFDVVRASSEDTIPKRHPRREPRTISSRDGDGDGDGDGTKSGARAADPWRISFRSEWKTHHLGLPLSHQDRFFSTHNATHYVMYIWQPTRSPWGEDAPLERLIVWEIGHPELQSQPQSQPQPQPCPADEPRITRRMTNSDLSTWGIRQLDTPRLRSLALDDETWDPATGSPTGHVFFVEEEHRWCAGPHSSPDPPRQHRLRCTGIPLVGDGPRWVDDCGGPSRSDERGGMDFCSRGREKRSAAGSSAVVADTWPGRTPCWRHDDFPYLTVSEVYDARAGVRITARHCFMMETLSVHVRPQLCVEGVTRYSGEERRVPGGGKTRCDDAGHRHRRLQGPDGEEVQFEDGWWAELMGKGCIVGDERWVVGEDEGGDVTILMF
jgi:hypothetical protein